MVLLIAGTSHTGKTALEAEYLQETQCVCLVMSRQRVCQRGGAAGRGLEYILIDKDYQVNWEPKESRGLKL